MKEKTKRIVITLVKILLSYLACFMVYAGYCLISGERVSVSFQGEVLILLITALLWFVGHLWKGRTDRASAVSKIEE